MAIGSQRLLVYHSFIVTETTFSLERPTSGDEAPPSANYSSSLMSNYSKFIGKKSADLKIHETER
jgi:hypothetical protein